MIWWAPICLALCAAAVLHWTAVPGGNDARLLFGMWRASGFGLALLLALAAVGAALARRSRRALLVYAFAGLLLLSTVLLLELVGLTGLVSYPQLMGGQRFLETNELGSKPTPHLDVRGATTLDTATGWGLGSELIEFHYQTDRRGFRNPGDPDAADVYLLGDSVVVGALVPFESTVTPLVARDTGRSALSVALIGLSPQAEIDAFRRAALPVRGRLVLQFLFEGNDLIDSAIYRKNGGPAPLRPPTWRDRSFTDNAIRALQRLTQPVVGLAKRRMCTIDGQRYTFRWTFGSYRGLDAEHTALTELLGAFAEEIRAAGGEYAIVFVPTKLRALGPQCDQWPENSDLIDQIDANPLRATLQAFSERSGIELIDLTDPLRAASAQGEQPWFWGDTHWNARGHSVAAEAISEAPITRAWLQRGAVAGAGSAAIGAAAP